MLASPSEKVIKMCNFCERSNAVELRGGNTVHETANAYWEPTVGAFTDGYLLAIPNAHRLSLAACSPDVRREILAETIYVSRTLQPLYGPYVFGEHGSTQDDHGCRRMSHAHLHMIPAGTYYDEIFDRYCEQGGLPNKVLGADDLGELQDLPYLSLSKDANSFYIWTNPIRFPKQFIRLACAEVLGRQGIYNWRYYPCVDEMYRTKVGASFLLQQDIASHKQSDLVE